jgi:hypothetical protein
MHTPSIRARELAIEGEGARFAEAIETLYGIRVTGAPRSTSAGADAPDTGIACA